MEAGIWVFCRVSKEPVPTLYPSLEMGLSQHILTHPWARPFSTYLFQALCLAKLHVQR